MNPIRLFVLLLLTGFGITSVHAQSLESLRLQGATSAFYRHAEPSDITIEVQVWGTVRHPGLYEVRQGTDLSTLFSLAGGPVTTAQNQRSDRRLTVRLVRTQPDGSNAVVYEVTMENELQALQQPPELMQGDVLVVEEYLRQRTNWRDVLSVISSVGTLAVVVLNIIRLSDN